MAKATEFQKRIAKKVLEEMADMVKEDKFNHLVFEAVAKKALARNGVNNGPRDNHGDKWCHLRAIRPLVERGFEKKIKRIRAEILGRESHDGHRVGKVIRRTAEENINFFKKRHSYYAGKHAEGLTEHMTYEQLGLD